MKTKKIGSDMFKVLGLILFGGLLLLTGLGALVSYMNLPITGNEDLLGPQLGEMAGMFIGLGAGSLALFHGLGILRGKQSSSMTLPTHYFLWIAFALTLAVGNALNLLDVARVQLFPLIFLLGAALPTLAVLSWAGRRLGWPISWRQASLTFVTGSTLSVMVVFLLGGLMTLGFLFLMPLEYLSESGLMGTAVPAMLLLFLAVIALQAPIPEELAKVLGMPLYGRSRITDERQAFMMGLAAGAGFAIVENMLYQGIYAEWSGWTWGGITLLRGFGAVLHPLCTGIVALGWYRSGNGRWLPLLKAYGAAVLLHTLWNGGFDSLVFLTGMDEFASLYGPYTVSIYGLGVQLMLILYVVFLSAGLWWLLKHIVGQMAAEETDEIAPFEASQRVLALWAFACVLVVVPIGAAIGPAWRDIQSVLLTGF